MNRTTFWHCFRQQFAHGYKYTLPDQYIITVALFLDFIMAHISDDFRVFTILGYQEVGRSPDIVLKTQRQSLQR